MHIPNEAVLLIPEPEGEGDNPLHGLKPGYYSRPQMLLLLDEYKGNGGAVRFIADMLETGDPTHDGFANLIRNNCESPTEIARIVKACASEEK